MYVVILILPLVVVVDCTTDRLLKMLSLVLSLGKPVQSATTGGT